MIPKLLKVLLIMGIGLAMTASYATAYGYDVTFNVNMEEAEDFDPDNYDVYITGEMTDWTEPGEDPDFMMEAHEDEDDVYTITLSLEEGDYEYKYFLVEDEPTWENGEWDGEEDRHLSVSGDMEVNDTFGNQPFEVTFNVNMEDAEDFDPDVYDVYVAGTFAGNWTEPGENPDFMLEPHEEEEDIFTITFHIEEGEQEYKYFLVEDEPTWENDEWEGEPNRQITIEGEAEFNDTWGNQEEATSVEEPFADAPESFELEQNHPNPFNPTTQINYTLHESAEVTLEVYNTLGQKVETLIDGQQLNSGQHQVNFDGSGLSSGTYIYRLTAGGEIQTRTMTLIK